MVRRIISTGRGGSGKTMFIALATRCLSATDYPSLVIDIDADQNLADMLEGYPKGPHQQKRADWLGSPSDKPERNSPDHSDIALRG